MSDNAAERGFTQEPIVIAACEVRHIHLRAEQPYIIRKMHMCAACEKYDALAQSTERGSVPSAAASEFKIAPNCCYPDACANARECLRPFDHDRPPTCTAILSRLSAAEPTIVSSASYVKYAREMHTNPACNYWLGRVGALGCICAAPAPDAPAEAQSQPSAQPAADAVAEIDAWQKETEQLGPRWREIFMQTGLLLQRARDRIVAQDKYDDYLVAYIEKDATRIAALEAELARPRDHCASMTEDRDAFQKLYMEARARAERAEGLLRRHRDNINPYTDPLRPDDRERLIVDTDAALAASQGDKRE